LVDKDFIRRLMASTKCRLCGQRYDVNNIKVFGHQKDLWLVALSCSACHTRYLAVINIEEDMMPNIITDLTEVEQDKFSNLDGLSADDVLDVHSFLKDFNGDLSQLFDQKET